MRKMFLAPLLAATPLSAQTKTTKHSCPAEDIPSGAVEPAYGHDSVPYCPREDYELKWFVQEYDFSSPGIVYDSRPGSFYGTVTKIPLNSARSYYFKPMCLPKEEKQ